jgi:hypothetical protein
MNRNWFGRFHHNLSGNDDKVDTPPMTKFPAHPCFLLVVIIMFGRHLQKGYKKWFVFDSLHIVCEILTPKAIYVILKLLPFLIRYLLIHVNYLPSSFSIVLFHA